MIVYKYNHHIIKLFYRILNKFEPGSSVSSSPTHSNTLAAKENNEISELPGYVSPSARNVEIDAAESARGISKSELYQISIVFTLSHSSRFCDNNICKHLQFLQNLVGTNISLNEDS